MSDFEDLLTVKELTSMVNGRRNIFVKTEDGSLYGVCGVLDETSDNVYLEVFYVGEDD